LPGRRTGTNSVYAKEIGHSDEELAAYLLCSKCENLLNRDGETWLVPKLATAEQSFPFYDLLVQGQPDVVEPISSPMLARETNISAFGN